MPDNRQEEDRNKMNGSGWVYDSTRQQMLNVETGEVMSTLEWLVKLEKRMTKTNIKISTTTCPKCEYRPIPVVEGKPTICPVCSNVINGGKK